MTATAAAARAARRRSVSVNQIAWLALFGVSIVLFVLFSGQWTLPHDDDKALFLTLNEIRDWLDANHDTVPLISILVDGSGGIVRIVTDFVIDGLVAIGWPGVIALAAFVGYAAGGLRFAVFAAAGFVVVGALDLWEATVETLGLTLAAVLFSVLIGIPLGILAGRNARFRGLITPVLDVMQIMPTFAYLAPFALFYGIGAGPAAIVTLVYAMPAAIRITALGIRGVPETTIEAAASLGATGSQVLTKVQIPLSRRAIGLAVNQTIMLALSMVVITALIDAPGLGSNLLRALALPNGVGVAFDAGLAVVILAILIDRVTERASRSAEPGVHVAPAARRLQLDRRVGLIAFGLIALAGIGLGIALGESVAIFPTDLASISFREPINAIVSAIKSNLFDITDGLKNVVTAVLLDPLQAVLTKSPFWLVIAALTAAAYLVSGARAAITVAIGLGIVALIGLWEHTMLTMAQVLLGTLATMAIGVTLGILAARSRRFSIALRPLLDFAQTLPAFVYLIPALALFSPTRFTAIVAAVIFAVPPVVRIVETGIRLVPATTIEAASAAGSTARQLLWKVQLPMARPAMMLALNQGIVMVLGMVVVGGLVGGGGLGHDVVSGFSQTEDFGEGFAAGIALVLVGIVLDRLSRGAGRRNVVERIRVSRARSATLPPVEGAASA